jgi:glycosyltransferase involved in cell wall biosynthesis
MACGVPVIASANTGGEDLFTDGVEGFVVPARAPDVLRERLQWMLDNPARRREMGAAARERVKDLGGWASFARDSRNVYLGVGAGAPARRPIGG